MGKTLYELLRNEKYIEFIPTIVLPKEKKDGTRNYHSYKDPSDIIRIPGGCPALCGPENMALRPENNGAKQKVHLQQHGQRVYILSGKVFCGPCGGKMYENCKTTQGKIHYYYVCSNGWRKHTCSSRHIPAEELEEEVIETLEKKIFTSEFSKEVSEQLQNNIQKNQEITQKQRGSISAQLQNVNSKIKNL